MACQSRRLRYAAPRWATISPRRKPAGTDAERKIRLIANLAELPPAVIHRLDMKDYAQLPILRTCSKREMALPSIRQALDAIKIGA